LYIHEIPDVLGEWKRVLKNGGCLVLELPCKDKVFHHIRTAKKFAHDTTMNAFYGDITTTRGEHDLHKWLWSKDELAFALDKAGFRDLRSEKPLFHVPDRDMRMVAFK
jgi:ubiquinone/menaquinone biosynthesis C-methylase UbiE